MFPIRALPILACYHGRDGHHPKCFPQHFPVVPRVARTVFLGVLGVVRCGAANDGIARTAPYEAEEKTTTAHGGCGGDGSGGDGEGNDEEKDVSVTLTTCLSAYSTTSFEAFPGVSRRHLGLARDARAIVSVWTSGRVGGAFN